MSLDYKPEFDVILSEDGDDRSTTPMGELYADHAVLMDYDTRVVEWVKRTDDTFSWFEVAGSDLGLSDDDEAALNGYRDLTDAIEFAKRWYLNRIV